MELLLNRVGKLHGVEKETDTYCVGFADYIFITDKGVECKIQENQKGEYVLVLLCREDNHIDQGQEAELKYDLFSSLDELKKKLQCYDCYIDWKEENCFSVNAFRYNVPGKIMNGKYKDCICVIEDNNGEYTLLIYNKKGNECEEVIFFEGFEEMKKKCPFIIDFS